MGKIVADSGVAYCLMHNRDKITEEMDADLFIGQMKEDAKRALDAGIKKERIILDPGVGFAKTQEQNLMTIANLDRLKALGTSRKSVIGYVLDVPTDKRLVGTLATSAVAVQTGCMFVRVHDVKENVELIQMLERIRESR
jgi:dihydropteroate synthase